MRTIFWRNIAMWSVSGIFLSLAFFWGLLISFDRQHIDLSALDQADTNQPSIVLDDAGQEWFRFALDKRESIEFEAIPPVLIHAFIAAEDWQFFSHSGISFKGIVRSLLVNLYHRRKVQGASTITQQLVKLLFFDTKKTFARKIKEQWYALLVERQYTKEQILESYLNHIYFGAGIYGIAAASQRFWRKNVSQLTAGQAASLAAIIRNPRYYCPLFCPQSCQQRRDVILRSMMNLGFLSSEQYADEIAQPLELAPEKGLHIGQHIRELVRQKLEQQFGKTMLYRGGLVIQTTINRTMQENGEKVFREYSAEIRKRLRKNVDGALLSIDGKTGGIKALVGGFDFSQSQFNRATQAKRQMGSIFKPLVYAAAIAAGHSFAQVEIDEPLELAGWRPNNYNELFEGPMTLAYALAHSNNIVAIKLLLHVGIQPVIALAKQLHLQGPFKPYPSLALGCVDETLINAVGMFNMFAHGGSYVKPYYLAWVKDRWGNKIWQEQIKHEAIIDSRVSDAVAAVLGINFKRVEGLYKGRLNLQTQAISKTGTTDDCRTCWFIGSTPQITTGVYIGCDDNSSLGKSVFPSKTAFPIWHAFHRTFDNGARFSPSNPALRSVTVHEKNGKLVANDDPCALHLLV